MFGLCCVGSSVKWDRPDSTIVIDYMLAKVTDLIEHLVVYPDRMRRNLELTGGLVYSQRLLLALIEKGAQRKESYEAVQRNAMVSWRGGGALQELAGKDPFISQHLKNSEIAACFNPKYYLRHLDQIYRRVFGRDHTVRWVPGGEKARS